MSRDDAKMYAFGAACVAGSYLLAGPVIASVVLIISIVALIAIHLGDKPKSISGYLGLLGLKPPPPPPQKSVFQVKINVLWHGSSDGPAAFWVQGYTGSGVVISPSQLDISVRLINISERPVTIDAMKFEVKANGKWEKLERMFIGGKVFMVFNKPDVAWQIEIEEFYSRIEQKSLPPHEPITGWILYQFPHEDFEFDPNGERRFTIVDSTGNVSVVDVTAPPSSELKYLASDSLQYSHMKILDKHADISNLPATLRGKPIELRWKSH